MKRAGPHAQHAGEGPSLGEARREQQGLKQDIHNLVWVVCVLAVDPNPCKEGDDKDDAMVGVQDRVAPKAKQHRVISQSSSVQ